MAALPGDLAMQPRFGRTPLSTDSSWRESSQFRRLFDRKSSEVMQLNDPAQRSVELFKRLQGIAEGNKIDILSCGNAGGLVEQNPSNLATTLGSAVGPCVVNKDVAHNVRSCTIKLQPVPTGYVLAIRQAQVDFVD